MAGFTNILRTRQIVVTLGLLIAVLLIWFIGKSFDLSPDFRFILIFSLLLIALIAVGIRRVLAVRGAAQLEQSLKSQASEQVMGVRPEKREEIEQLRQQLDAAIDSLKKSKLARGQRGRAALYALPWYMMIGPPAAGKTTAIRNSGIEFPFGADREIQGVGGTRNCDWWFSNSAIFLDTAGRYTTEEEDREEWASFLDMLKKHRKRRPINGVIVAMSIVDLLNASESEIDGHAKKIRARIDELLLRLETTFPVYLVFTKCDLMGGFVEFFQEFTRSQREQVWGCTFTKDQLTAPKPQVLFEQEYDILVRALIPMRSARLSTPMKRQDRGRVFAFPLEFASGRRNLSHFVGKLFQPNPYQESPLFRGFYFTSGTQEGVPIDRVVQSVAKTFDLPAALTEQFNPEMETKSYFIRDLLCDVVVPDQNMVDRSSRAQKSGKLLRLAVFGLVAFGLVAFILGVTQAYFRSKVVLDSLDKSAAPLKMIKWDDETAIVENLKKSNAFLNRLNDVERHADEAWILSFGMDRSSSVMPEGIKMYFNKILPLVQQVFLSEYENRLNAEPRVELLKGYLLLTSERGKIDTSEARFLKASLIKLMDERFQGKDRKDDLMTHARALIDYLVLKLPEKDDDGVSIVPTLTMKKELVERARFKLYETPTIDNLYKRIKSESVGRLEPSVFADRTFGLSENSIEGIFTKTGWDSYMRDAIASQSTTLGKEDWVLAPGKAAKLPPEMLDNSVLEQKLRELYFNEYAQSWIAALSRVRYAPSRDIADAKEKLRLLGDPTQSPLLGLLKNVVSQTRFEDGLAEAAENGSGIIKDVAKKTGIPGAGDAVQAALGGKNPVNQRFGALCQFVQGASGGEPGVNDILRQYALLGDDMDALNKGPNEAVKDYAAKVVGQKAGKLPEALGSIRNALRRFDPSLREALGGMFEDPVMLTWGAVVADAQRYLNSQWNSRVADEFKLRLAPYYPFNRDERRDAPMADVLQFFDSPEGTLWSFYKGELEDFVHRDTWAVQLWEGVGIVLSEDMRSALRQATTLSKTLKGGVTNIEVEIRPQPPSRTAQAPIVEKINLMINGQDIPYQMGGLRPTKIKIPGDKVERGAYLEIFGAEGLIGEKRFDGDWGWYRLVKEARTPRSISPQEYVLEWTFSGEGKYEIIVRYIVVTSRGVNPFSTTLSEFRCPQRLN
jgi:type VI secretion system protein ImpL